MIRIFITELKNRSLLILFNSLFFINLLYVYKDVIFFIIFKKLIIQNNITSYLVYSNIFELFSIYLMLINFINTFVTSFHFVFHGYVFLSSALLNIEFFVIKNLLIILIQIYIFVVLLSVKLLPGIFNYFEKYQEPFMHFELKIDEFVWVFIYLLKNIPIYFLGILSFYKFNSLKFIKKTVVRKLYYVTYVTIFLLAGFTNDTIFTIIIVSLLIITYEISLITFLIATKLKIK